MSNNILQSTLKVLVYFDVLNYPLTALEIYHWLDIKVSMPALLIVLENSHQIETKNGFYFLAGREELLTNRQERYVLAHHYFKKAGRVIWWLSHWPWVRAIAVYSSLSYANSSKNSDIDLFVVATGGRVWSARFFVNLFLKIFGLRPNVKTSRGKICVSYLVDENHLDLLSAVGKMGGGHYLMGTGQFVFLYDSHHLRKDFFYKNQSLFKALPQWDDYLVNWQRKVNKSFKPLKKILEVIFSFYSEDNYRWLQMKIMPNILKQKNKKGIDVILGDKIIKLHAHDKRKEINQVVNYKLKCLKN